MEYKNWSEKEGDSFAIQNTSRMSLHIIPVTFYFSSVRKQKWITISCWNNISWTETNHQHKNSTKRSKLKQDRVIGFFIPVKIFCAIKIVRKRNLIYFVPENFYNTRMYYLVRSRNQEYLRGKNFYNERFIDHKFGVHARSLWNQLSKRLSYYVLT